MMRNYNFPLDKNYFIVTGGIPDSFGGLTNSLLKKAKIFGEKANIPTKIITYYFKTDWEDTLNKLIQDGKLNRKYTEIINLYDYFQGDVLDSKVKKPIPFDEKGYNIAKVPKRNAYRFFYNGMYKMFKCYEKPDKQLKFIDYFNEFRNRTKREEFDNEGRIRKITYFDNVTNLPKQELYYDPNEKCYLSKWHKIIEGKNQVERIYWFDKNGDIRKTFYSQHELQVFWLNQLIKDDQEYFLMSESRRMEPTILEIDRENVYKISVIHSIHYKNASNKNSDIRPTYKPIFNQLNSTDATVFLTNKQLEDVRIRFGNRNNYFAIPHSIDTSSMGYDFDKKDVNKAVVVSRLSAEKQLTDTIRAFSIASKINDNIELHIYGDGPEKKQLTQLIKECNLENKVFLRGYTNDVANVYKGAAFSILTSKFEGFGLVILESLKYGCPVISYDINYGPSDLIRDDYNGYLIENKNISDIAEKMSVMFSDQAKLKTLSDNAYSSATTFNDEAFLTNWAHLFQTITKQKTFKNNIYDMKLYLERSEWKDSGAVDIYFNLYLDGEYNKEYLEKANIYLTINVRNSRKVRKVPVSRIQELDMGFMLETTIDFSEFNLREGEVWDVNVNMEFFNTYISKRIGDNKKENIFTNTRTKIVNHYPIDAYFTNPYGNLSFKIGKPNLRKELELNKKSEKGKTGNKMKNAISSIMKKIKEE